MPEATTAKTAPGKTTELLEAIEESIALTDRQRLLVLRTTDLAVMQVIRDSWPELKSSSVITRMVARRMFNHYKTQIDLKKQISLSRIESASGVLQRVVGSYLAAYLSNVSPRYAVWLDKRYSGDIHPDIAVERDAQPFSAIEMKTDLGWQRDYISSGAWDARRKNLVGAGFSHSYLVVLANTNWAGWSPPMRSQNVYVLLPTSPNMTAKFKWYEDERAPLDIMHPLENVFEQIAPWPVGHEGNIA
jgi:hypothetical protein